MTTRRTPDGQVYTEVPVVPRHDQLDGRSLGNSHPISAITGLQEALDSKADAVDGGNLVTDEEKARIETMEANAQENVVEVVKVNGTALVPDASKAVDVTVPTAYGKSISYSGSSGKLSLKGPTGSTLSEVTMPRKGLTSMALNSDTKALTATLQDGSTVSVDISAAADPYTAGNGLALADGAFSLSSQTQGLMEDLADHLSDQAAHVSAADRASWEGVASGAVRTTGNQTIAGIKTFSSPVTVGTPTGVSHAATKQYVDGKDQTAVHVTGNETIAGSKAFSSPVAVGTPTADGHAATKAYVDGAILNAVGGDWVIVDAEDIGSELFEDLFEVVVENRFFRAKTDVQVAFCFQTPSSWFENYGFGDAVDSYRRGDLIPAWPTVTAVLGVSTALNVFYGLKGAFSSYPEAGGVMTGLDNGTLVGGDGSPLAEYSETPFAKPEQDASNVTATFTVLYRATE